MTIFTNIPLDLHLEIPLQQRRGRGHTLQVVNRLYDSRSDAWHFESDVVFAKSGSGIRIYLNEPDPEKCHQVRGLFFAEGKIDMDAGNIYQRAESICTVNSDAQYSITLCSVSSRIFAAGKWHYLTANGWKSDLQS